MLILKFFSPTIFSFQVFADLILLVLRGMRRRRRRRRRRSRRKIHLKGLHPRLVLDLQHNHEVLLQPVLHRERGGGLEEREEKGTKKRKKKVRKKGRKKVRKKEEKGTEKRRKKVRKKGGKRYEKKEEEEIGGGGDHLGLVEDTLVDLLPALELHRVDDGQKSLGEVEARGSGRLKVWREWRRRRGKRRRWRPTCPAVVPTTWPLLANW